MKSYHVDFFDVEADEEGPVTALHDYEGDHYKLVKNFTSASTMQRSQDEDISHTLNRNSIQAQSLVSQSNKPQ